MIRFAVALLLAFTVSAVAQTPAPAEAAASTPAPIVIHVDLASPQGPYKPISSWFGYDESNFTTMKYGRQLLTELDELSPVPVYIRAITSSPRATATRNSSGPPRASSLWNPSSASNGKRRVIGRTQDTPPGPHHSSIILRIRMPCNE